MKKTIILAFAALSAACSSEEPGALPRSEDPVRVSVSTPAATRGVRTFPATVVAANEARLATRMSSTILEMPADVGSRVQAGDTLVLLDGEDVRARIAAAHANVDLARKSFQRLENLAREGAASQAELDRAGAGLLAAEAALADARVQGRYAVLTAPFAGTITHRSADPGDLAAPGVPLITVMGSGGLKIEADLPSSLQGRIVVGDSLPLVVSGAGSEAGVVVTRVVPALEAGSRRFRVEARFESGTQPSDLISGSYVRLGIYGEEEGVRWIPADALIRKGQLTGVYVVEGGHLRLRWVRLGEDRGEAIEMLAGPSGVMQIVRRPVAGLFDGQSVSEAVIEAWEVTS